MKGKTEVSVAGRVSMNLNLKFIEGGKAGYKVAEFRGVGVAYKEVVDSKGEAEQ